MNQARLMLAIGCCFGSGCAWLPGGGEEPVADVTTPQAAIESGVSAVSGDGPIWLAATQPGLSAVAKDYLFAGPMMVNREGVRRQYLWFALGTTVDRRLNGVADRELDSVVLVVDGTPMTFELIAWNAPERVQPYTLPFASDQSYAARVTQSQIRQIAAADNVEAFVTDTAGRSPTYALVHGDPARWLPSDSLQAEVLR